MQAFQAAHQRPQRAGPLDAHSGRAAAAPFAFTARRPQLHPRPFTAAPGHTGSRRDTLVLREAAAAGASPSGDASQTSFLSAFWKFLRPHTIRGTILGTSAVVSRALLENQAAIDWSLLPRALLGLAALLCGNGYIVGINQIYDVDIDVVNKPFLPVAAGELSTGLAWALVLGLAATGLGIVATNFGSLITSLYALGLTLGTVYSIPPFRLKQYAIPAFLIIAVVRGFLLNFGVYHATRAALGLEFVWNAPIAFITTFVTVFATAIAITKDLPDVEGDKANNIETFATKLGVPKVSLLGVSLLLANYVGAVVLAFTQSSSFNVPVMAGAHSVLAVVLVLRTAKLHSARYTQAAVQDFYRWVWNLFYAEYLLFPIL